MAMKKSAARVSNTYTFVFDTASGERCEVRVDDRPLEVLHASEARTIADNIMHAGGLLCATCLSEAAVRYVLTDAPTVAMCWDCYDRKTTTGAHY